MGYDAVLIIRPASMELKFKHGMDINAKKIVPYPPAVVKLSIRWLHSRPQQQLPVSPGIPLGTTREPQFRVCLLH